ncbi:unnamed protein product [Cuscuta campestris]|uniref:PB1 domain-containing protein n=1 Tax=Cuscuta campestris TaxID=132261 RepID=A0A484LGC1_9ASTE|nr:unnamed protein product [Cuscuta campestris]
MGKQKKKHAGCNFHGSSKKKTCPNSPKAYDRDTTAALSLSQELKEEGNRLFQTRDYEEAMLMYERAIQLLPANNEDISYLRSNLAACYMQFGESGYARAIHECNLALEVNPKCTKALLKRSRCYEALVRLDLALRDAKRVLEMEPNNFMAAEIAERVEETIEENGGGFDIPVDLIPVPEYVEPRVFSASKKGSKGKARKKKAVDGMSDEPKHGKENKVDGNQLNVSLKRGRNKKKKKKAKNKEVAYGDNVEMVANEENNVEEESGIDVMKAKNRKEKKMKKKKNKRVRNMKEMGIYDVEGTNDGDMSDEEEAVEYNRFEILNDVELNPDNFEGVVMENNVEDGKSEIETKAEIEELSEEKKSQDKLVVEEIMSKNPEVEAKRQVKLIYGEDIRIAYIPINCSILKLREIVCSRFPNCKAILIKYKDQEGDLITITRNEELRWAETSTLDQCSTRLHIVDVNPGQDPLLEMIKQQEEEEQYKVIEHESEGRSGLQNMETFVNDWIIHFAYLFKDYAGFESDCYLGLHEVGVKAYSEAMEETVSSEEAQYIFSTAEEKFRELASLALFNWGNVHMFRARRRVFAEYGDARDAHVWAQEEYSLAGRRFEEALKMNPNFYEVIIAMGQLQFEQAKLSWYCATTTGAGLESSPSSEVPFLYKNAGKNMERGIQMWEEALVQHLLEVTNQCETDELLRQMKLENLFSEISAEETAERAANIRSQVNLLWGTMMYKRSAMEFKLGLPSWQASLEAAADKFELAGASPEDIAVMIKNHCSNSLQGVDVDETEQAWNEMYGAIRWQMDIPALYLDPLLQKRVSVTRHAPDLP